MIENDDTATQPQQGPDDGAIAAATIQIPAAQAEAQVPPAPTPIPAASGAPVTSVPALPYMSVDDLLALHIVSAPQLSPDGSWVAFAAQQSDAAQNTTSSAIWLVNARGGKGETPRQLTNLEHTTHDLEPHWSPDGNTLAYVSDRNGASQIYLLSMHGGEARQVSHLSQGVSEFNWRPDGAALLAHSPWKPEDDGQQPDTSATSVVFTRLDEQWDGMGFKNGRHQQLWLIPRRSDAPHG